MEIDPLQYFLRIGQELSTPYGLLALAVLIVFIIIVYLTSPERAS